MGRGGRRHVVPAGGGSGQNLCVAACVEPGVKVQNAPRTFTAHGDHQAPWELRPKAAGSVETPRMYPHVLSCKYQHVSHTSAFLSLRNHSFCELTCLRFGPEVNQEPGWLTVPIRGSGRRCPWCFFLPASFPLCGDYKLIISGAGQVP